MLAAAIALSESGLHKADSAAAQHVLEAAQLEECKSSADIAAYVQKHFSLQLSRRTVQQGKWSQVSITTDCAHPIGFQQAEPC